MGAPGSFRLAYPSSSIQTRIFMIRMLAVSQLLARHRNVLWTRGVPYMQYNSSLFFLFSLLLLFFSVVLYRLDFYTCFNKPACKLTLRANGWQYTASKLPVGNYSSSSLRKTTIFSNCKLLKGERLNCLTLKKLFQFLWRSRSPNLLKQKHDTALFGKMCFSFISGILYIVDALIWHIHNW